MLSFLEKLRRSRRKKKIESHIRKMLDLEIISRRLIRIHDVDFLLYYLKTYVKQDVHEELLKELENKFMLWKMEDEVDDQAKDELRKRFSDVISK